MAVTSIYYGEGWGSSFSGTLNLPQGLSAAVAQVALTHSEQYYTPGYCQVYLTDYSANGNPVPVTDGSVVLVISNPDSFSFEGGAANGFVISSIMAYCFE